MGKSNSVTGAEGVPSSPEICLKAFEKASNEEDRDGMERAIAMGMCDEGTLKSVELPNTSFTTSKLQHEFKHAGDFGVTGNWNKATGEVYQKAIQNHIDTATDVYKLTYRGQDVNVFINKNTGVGAYTDLSGNYIGGWKFSSDQMNFHLTNGTKIK